MVIRVRRRYFRIILNYSSTPLFLIKSKNESFCNCERDKFSFISGAYRWNRSHAQLSLLQSHIKIEGTFSSPLFILFFVLFRFPTFYWRVCAAASWILKTCSSNCFTLRITVITFVKLSVFQRLSSLRMMVVFWVRFYCIVTQDFASIMKYLITTWNN